MYPFSGDLECNSRDTPGCKGLDLGALSKRFSYGTGGGRWSGGGRNKWDIKAKSS